MRRPLGLAITCTAFLFLADAEVPAQLLSTGPLPLEPASTDPPVILSPEQQKRLQGTINQWIIQRDQMSSKMPLENLHDLLDQALTGDQLPSVIKPSFVELFAPSKNALHQFLNDQNTRLKQRFQIGGQSEGQRSQIEEPFVVRRAVGYRPDPESHELHTAAYRAPGGPHSPRNGFLWPTQSGAGTSGTVTQDGVTITATDSEEGVVTTAEASGDPGNGMTVKVTGEDWHSTDNWIATGGGLGLGVQGESKGVSGSMNIYNMDGAKVKRCPSATGVAPGKSRERNGFKLTATDSKGTTYLIETTSFTQAIAEGHVGDDAIVKDVTANVTTTATGRWNSDVYVLRVDGTATFDPHSKDRPSLKITGCSSNARTPSGQECDQLARSLSLVELKRAYRQAENAWNFVEQDESGNSVHPSACIKVKFTPKTRTVRGRPKQSIPVKAEIITIQGEQSTWGHFDELWPWVTDDGTGRIQENGAATVPGSPAQLTYTAPANPWPPNKPPGFYVRKMTSRAGAFKWGIYVSGLDSDSFIWLLKAGLKLSIHHKWEVKSPLGGLVSETTFPIDLMPNERGDLFGQTFVPRTYRQVESFCTDTGQWSEQWQAYAMFDEKGENLTIKLRFDSSPKQALTVCPPPVPPTAHTVPGFRSDSVRTPLDQFKMPAQDKAKQQFVFDFGGFAKNVVDVTLIEDEYDWRK